MRRSCWTMALHSRRTHMKLDVLFVLNHFGLCDFWAFGRTHTNQKVYVGFRFCVQQLGCLKPRAIVWIPQEVSGIRARSICFARPPYFSIAASLAEDVVEHVVFPLKEGCWEAAWKQNAEKRPTTCFTHARLRTCNRWFCSIEVWHGGTLSCIKERVLEERISWKK